MLAAALLQGALQPWGVVVSAIVRHLTVRLLRTLELGIRECAVANSENVVNVNVGHKRVEFVKKAHAGISRPREVGAVKITLLGLKLVV